MNTVFIGGSRRVPRLPVAARDRVDKVIENGLAVSVGDANGADKAVQKHLADARYDRVTVYCSGDSCRNNIGRWKTRHVKAKGRKKDFHFYAVKDREMACAAEFGLMIWDGKSPGTVLNVLRLVRASKKAVLINVPEQREVTSGAGTIGTCFFRSATSICVAVWRNEPCRMNGSIPTRHKHPSDLRRQSARPGNRRPGPSWSAAWMRRWRLVIPGNL